MKVIETKIPGVLIIEPKLFEDDRGSFWEAYQNKRYSENGISGPFVQDNLSFSKQGVLRGLHYQNPNAQGKLVYVLQGEVYDVAVDVRVGSPTFKHWVGCIISYENRRQLWVPDGFAHGFCVNSESALFFYKCTKPYSPDCEYTIRWDDPDINIQWPIESPEMSEKDKQGMLLSEISHQHLPVYHGNNA